MAFQPRETKDKVKSRYKTLYLSETLIEQIEQTAANNETSFNNVVVSMIEHCLNETEGEK